MPHSELRVMLQTVVQEAVKPLWEELRQVNVRLDRLEQGMTTLEQRQTALEQGLEQANNRLELLEQGQNVLKAGQDQLYALTSSLEHRQEETTAKLTTISENMF
ncbi:MAG: hypothetical protein PHC60_08235, partial [Heliobacteriaceae bacterium]|nr:hypothetical protein [Heliobacteriaceae bacterium]